MRYSREKQRFNHPKVWLFSSVLILGWGVVPMAVQASQTGAVVAKLHAALPKVANERPSAGKNKTSVTSAADSERATAAHSTSTVALSTTAATETESQAGVVKQPVADSASQRQTSSQSESEARTSATTSGQRVSESVAVESAASTSQTSASTSSSQVASSDNSKRSSNSTSTIMPSGKHSMSSQQSTATSNAKSAQLTNSATAQPSVTTASGELLPVAKDVPNSTTNQQSSKAFSASKSTQMQSDKVSVGAQSTVANKVSEIKPAITATAATVKQAGDGRTATASAFLATAKNLADKSYLEQYVKQYGRPALIALIQDWLSTYRIIALTGITIVNSSFDGSVATISGGLHVINAGATIRPGKDSEWDMIVNGGLSVTNNTITFTTSNGLVDRSVANQDMDYSRPRPTGNGAIKGVPTVTINSSLADPREFNQAQVNISDFYNQLVSAGTILPATNGGTLSKALIGESGTTDLGSYQGHHYYAVNIDLNDWHSGIRTTGFTDDDVVIYNVVTGASELTIGGGFSSSTSNLVWNFNQATRIKNTTAIAGKMVAPHAVFTTNQNVDSAAVLQYGYGDGDSAVWEMITSQNEHNYSFGQMVGDDPLAYLIAVIKSNGTVIDTLAGFQDLITTGELTITITDAAGNRLPGLNAVNTHVAGQHRYLITYQFNDQTATTWINVLASQEPVTPVQQVPEYSNITRTIQYQDGRTGKSIAKSVVQTVPVVRLAILNAETHELLGYDTDGDGAFDTSDGSLAWRLVNPTDYQRWAQVISPDLSMQGYQAPDIPVVVAQEVVINGGGITMNADVVVKYQQQTHVETTQRTITRTINYLDAGTLQAIDAVQPVVQTIKYELLTIIAHDGTILGYDTDGDGQVDTQTADEAWLLVGSAPWFETVKSPDLSSDGYAVPDLKVVPEQMVAGVNDKDVTINVYYRLATQAVTEYQNKRRVITYIDRQTHQSVAANVQQLVVYQRTAIIEKKTGKYLGYDLNGDGLIDTNQADRAWTVVGRNQFDAVASPDLGAKGYTDPDLKTVASWVVAVDDTDLTTVMVTYGHRTITVTPSDPNPIAPGNPNIVFPDESGEADLTHTVTRTIHYVYGDGTQVAAPVRQTVRFQRSVTIDLVTGQMTYQDWVPVTTATMASVISPIVADATATLATVAAQQVNATTADQVVTVI
ncbi:mucin-binding protein, partial [Lactiplantibacillus paraplantarum]